MTNRRIETKASRVAAYTCFLLTTEDGTLHGRVNGTHCIVLAAVK